MCFYIEFLPLKKGRGKSNLSSIGGGVVLWLFCIKV
jgi:hypothetical protein